MYTYAGYVVPWTVHSEPDRIPSDCHGNIYHARYTRVYDHTLSTRAGLQPIFTARVTCFHTHGLLQNA